MKLELNTKELLFGGLIISFWTTILIVVPAVLCILFFPHSSPPETQDGNDKTAGALDIKASFTSVEPITLPIEIKPSAPVKSTV